MNANRVREVRLGAGTVVAGASATTAMSVPFPISHLTALNGVIDATVSAVTVTTGVTLRLQDSSDGVIWNTVKNSAAVTATGEVTIRWNVEVVGDQGVVPLRPLARLVAVTGASDTVTLSSVRISQRG